MPYVSIRVIKGVTSVQCKQIVREITDTLVRVLDKNPDHTHIVFDEVEPDRWGFSGQLTSDLRNDDQNESPHP